MMRLTPSQMKMFKEAIIPIMLCVILGYGLIKLMNREKSVTGIPSTIGPPTTRRKPRRKPRKLRNMKEDEDGWN